MRKTYKQLQQELLHKTKSYDNLKNRVSSLKVEVRQNVAQKKVLINQYERVIKEWHKRYQELLNSGWKILFLKLNMKINKWKEAI